MLASAIMSSMAQNKLVANIRAASEARHIADGMVRHMILDRLRGLGQGIRTIGTANEQFPRSCLGPSSSTVLMIVEDEGGKLDLNFASEALLRRALQGFGVVQPDEITRAILRFRTESIVDGGRRGFQSVQELAAVLPRDQTLFRMLAPLVTVHAKQVGFDSTLAPSKLRAALALPGSPDGIPIEFHQPSGAMAYRMAADVTKADGSRFVRSALVSFSLDPFPTYTIEEWLRGTSLPTISAQQQNTSC
jgi:general secretion pathway protein K